MSALRVAYGLLLDALIVTIPYTFMPRRPYGFAFLVHPRDRRDIYRKIPFLRNAPEFLQRAFEYFWFPASVSRITGLKDHNGDLITGYVISIPMTAATMLRHRERALRQIRRAVHLARNRGARIIGLGALTASLTHGGMQLRDIRHVAITTGHAYTGYTVTETLLSFVKMSAHPLAMHRIAIVGAAGSIGSITAELLVRAGVRKLALIDVPRKRERVDALMRKLAAHAPDGFYEYHESLDVLVHASFIVTATNTPEALVRNEHVAPGTVIVDDAQPSDIAPELLDRADVIVAAAGAVFTPNIKTNFPMGLRGAEDNYCCLAEVLILAHQRRTDHFVLDRPTLTMVDYVAETGRKLAFHPAIHQNSRGHIEHAHIHRVIELLDARAV